MGTPSHALIDRARKQGRMSPEMSNEELLHLLATRVSGGAATARTLLLQEMATREWWIVRGAHTSTDQNPHVTVDCSGTRYHLQLDRAGSVFRITPGAGEVLGNEPSSAPGAAPGRMGRARA